MSSAPTLVSILAGLGVLFVTTSLASTNGWGLDAPERNPPSVREGSHRVRHGRRPARYFIGGGHRGGK